MIRRSLIEELRLDKKSLDELDLYRRLENFDHYENMQENIGYNIFIMIVGFVLFFLFCGYVSMQNDIDLIKENVKGYECKVLK